LWLKGTVNVGQRWGWLRGEIRSQTQKIERLQLKMRIKRGDKHPRFGKTTVFFTSSPWNGYKVGGG